MTQMTSPFLPGPLRRKVVHKATLNVPSQILWMSYGHFLDVVHQLIFCKYLRRGSKGEKREAKGQRRDWEREKKGKGRGSGECWGSRG